MKARQYKKIRFWSLRDTLGSNYGVIHDVDKLVTRSCRAVIGRFGLKWQLVKDEEYKHHYCNEADQECLDNMNFNDAMPIKSPMVKFSNNGIRGVSMREYNHDLPF